MNEARLADLIRRGLGRAAIAAGAWCDAYRPAGPDDPLADDNRFLRLNAAFTSLEGDRPVLYGQAAWRGIFDAAYTRAGDYIVRTAGRSNEDGIWFIADQPPLLPVVCIRATRILSLARPAAPATNGVNSYGGITPSTATPLARGWPASVLAAHGSGLDATDLPADAPPGTWWVLLPTIPAIVLRPGDILTDDLLRTAVISTAELTGLGWRILAKQATT